MLRPLALTLFTFGLPAAFAQPPADQPRFEVASVRPSNPHTGSPMFVGMSADGAMVKYTNITLRDCVRGAYRVREFQIAGPDWITKARFEISAKLPSGVSADQIPEMLQALLVERFKLEIRRDTKEQNVYALLVGNGGAKLKPAAKKADSKLPTALGPDGKPRDIMMFKFAPAGNATITAPSASAASLAWLMSRFTARPVVDMTGIEGQYDFNLTFAAETWPDMPPPPAPETAASEEPAPSLFDAVKQYGLRLEARRAPLEMLTIIHAERTPAEN